MKNCDEIVKDVLDRRDEHAKKVKKRNKMILRVGVPTVSLCLAAIIGVGMWRSGEIDPSMTAEDAVIPGINDVIDPPVPGGAVVTDDKKIPEPTGAYAETIYPSKDGAGGDFSDGEDEIWIEPQWAEKALYTKYPSIDLGNNKTFSTAATWIQGEMVGDTICAPTAYGYDIYTDKEYTIGVTVYAIEGISTDVAIAVSYDGFDGQYAVYTDNWYYPETLGEFIDALDLRENLTLAIRDEVPTGTIYHTFWEYESYMTTRYKLYDTAVIWSMLFSDTSLKNVANEVTDEEMSHYKESMSIGVNVDILGIKNVSLSVTENGYISTNILGTRKLFYIGEERAQEFFDYVEANFEPVREEIPSTTATVTEGPEAPTVTEVVTAVTETSTPRVPKSTVPVDGTESKN